MQRPPQPIMPTRMASVPAAYLESEIQTELGFEEIIGQSPALREVLKKVLHGWQLLRHI